MEPTAVINAISFTVIVLSLLSIRRNKREMRRIEDTRRTREAAPSRTITQSLAPTVVGPSLLPTRLDYDNRAAQTHGDDVSVHLGKAVDIHGFPTRVGAGYVTLQPGDVYDLDHRFDDGLLVAGADKWMLARTVVRQWTAAGFDALVLGSDAEPAVELWGTPGVRFAIGSSAPAAAATLRAEIDRRWDLLRHHRVRDFADLPAAVRPNRLLVVWAPKVTTTRLDGTVRSSTVFTVDAQAVEYAAREGRVVGVHLLVVEDSDLGPVGTSAIHGLVRWTCASVTSGFASTAPLTRADVELDAAWDVPLPTRFTYRDPAGDGRPFQAAVCDQSPLPVGWSAEDLSLALCAGWSAELVESTDAPTDSDRAAWRTLAALRG